ncbi:hypothetical protein [Erwinia phage Gungnir39]|nr:hypothetical protein [Erwinia phage Gungnir39]
MGCGFPLQRLIKTVCNELLLCYFVSADVAHKGVKMKLIDIASNVTSWNGDGLPPVGCECEYSLNGNVWRECIIEIYVGTQGVVMSCDVFEGMQYVNFIYYPNTKFRPIRTEAERKRESIIHALDNILGQALDQDASLPVEIYKAIAAGNIRGLKLED